MDKDRDHPARMERPALPSHSGRLHHDQQGELCDICYACTLVSESLGSLQAYLQDAQPSRRPVPCDCRGSSASKNGRDTKQKTSKASARRAARSRKA